MVRKILYALLAVGPLVVVLDRAGASDMVLFSVAAAALIPLAWLIGEATEHAAQHTGPGIGGFLNATFGNAPELIIALFAVSDGLTEVVRGSLSARLWSCSTGPARATWCSSASQRRRSFPSPG